MPEGHVTHRLAIELTERFAGTATRSTSPQGRFATEAAEIDGHPLDFAEAYGKNLFAHVGGRTVHVHLGLAGKWNLAADDSAEGSRPVLGAIRWRLENDLHYADLRGPQACALVSPDRQAEITGALGPDPLRPDADPEIGWQRVRVSKMPFALLLMDQRVSAGVGNIFRAEVLYRHRIDPMMPGRLLRHAEWDAVWDDLVALMDRRRRSRPDRLGAAGARTGGHGPGRLGSTGTAERSTSTAGPPSPAWSAAPASGRPNWADPQPVLVPEMSATEPPPAARLVDPPGPATPTGRYRPSGSVALSRPARCPSHRPSRCQSRVLPCPTWTTTGPPSSPISSPSTGKSNSGRVGRVLTDEEYLWEPVREMWSVRPSGTGRTPMAVGGGGTEIDYQIPEPKPVPVTTIAWRIGHLLVGVFGERNARYFDGPAIDYATYVYPMSATEALTGWTRLTGSGTRGFVG